MLCRGIALRIAGRFAQDPIAEDGDRREIKSDH